MIWIFDLDNTLHDASHAIFPAISENMNRFIAKAIMNSEDEKALAKADALRLFYWKRYGATLPGLLKHHDVKANAFLKAAHDLPDLASMIRSERNLSKIIKKLPGKKILLTNSAYRYSCDVLKHLGLRKNFMRHVSIESMTIHGRLSPKPSRKLLQKLIASEKKHPSQCVLVEDSESNLKVARSMGMRTVLVTRYTGKDRFSGHATPHKKTVRTWHRPAFVDVKIQSVRKLPLYSGRLVSNKVNP